MEFDFDYDYDYDDDHFDYGDDYEDGGWDDDHGIYNSDDDDYQPQVGDEADAVQQIDEEQIEEEEEEVEGDEDEQYDDEVVLVDEQYDDEDELAQDYEGEEEEEHGDLEEGGEEDEEQEQEQEVDEEESEEHQEEEDEDVDDVEEEEEPRNWGNGVEEEEEEEEEEEDDDDVDVDDDYDDDDEYGLQDYIPFTSTIRGSSNPVLSMPNVYEERLQHQPPPPPEQPPQQQQQEQVERRETVAIPQITENAVGVDERRVEENDQRRREEGESASSSTKGIESEGTSKRGESIGNMADGGCCSICMEPWASEGDHQVSCLPCGHVYGLSCIKTWVQRSTYSKCPQCNRQCRLEDIITLYVSRLAVSNGEQQKKILSLQAENEFLKMKSKEEWEELNRIIGKMNTDHEEKNKRLSEQIDEMRKLIKRICDEGLKRLDE